MRRRLLFALALLAGALILLIASEWASITRVRPPAPASPAILGPSTSAAAARSVAPPNAGITGGPTPVRAFGVSPIPPPPPEGPRSSLADHLNDPRRTARDDVAGVAEIFANYLQAFHRLPIGTNPEITAALAGDNPRGLTPLPADSAAIDGAGALVDRWGTPYFFHQLARDDVQIRSAGPDRKHFTADDITWPDAGTRSIPSVAQTAP